MSSDKLADYFAKLKKKHEYVLSAADVERVDLEIEQYVTHLVSGESRRLFGDFDIGEKLCKCFLSLCLRNEEKNIVAVLCVDDYPNVPAIPPWEWGHWLYNLYKLEKIDPSNTLWVHCVVWNLDYTYKMFKPLLQALFLRCWYLEYVILVAPPGFARVDWLEEHATRIFPEGNYNPKMVQTLYLIVRQNYVKKYKIRRAVEEDNDDLVPLVHEHSERLQELYGEYYVAEMLTRHPDDGRQMIVAEEGGYAVAMLCLNEAVNYDALNDNFEMAPFYGLRKPHDDDSLGTPQASVITISPLDELDMISTHQNDEFTPCHSASIESFASEIELEVHSEESEDDFTIVSMTSIHMDETEFIADEDMLESRESEYSCVMLSFNEYDMHLYSDKNKTKSVSMDNLNLKKISLRDTSRGIPTYHGEGNAFTLELAVSKPEYDDALRLLLEAAFECFPERKYCVMAVPATCPPFPLLDYFVRVTPRAVSSFPHEIYVLHRNAIASYMSVRQADSSDLEPVENLLARIPRAEGLIIDFETSVSDPNSEHLAYVFRSEEQIIGVAVVKEVEDLDYLRTHYEVMTWLSEVRHKPGSHGLIEHFVVSPIFQKQTRFFLRELHRLSDFSALYYKVTPSDTSRAQRDRCLPAILGGMVLVQPRQKPEFTHTNLEECCRPSEVVHRIDEPFALHLSTTRHCSIPRYLINTRIVVVGSSDTAIAFLEALLCTSDRAFQVTFTNVTVVAPHGLNYQKPPNKIRDMLFVTTNNLTHRHMNLIALGTYVNVVMGVMTAIDRKNKKLIINDNSFLPYDLLFLMCGSQYQKPKPLEEGQKKKDGISMSEYPENVFIINTEIDGNNALMKLKSLIVPKTKNKYKIIVYGHCLMAYCCLSALLEYGITGEHIIFVDPFPYTRDIKDYHEVSIFNDSEVDDAVMQSIKDQGITVYTSYQFLEWNYTSHGNKITSVKFLSKTKLIDIECVALFIYCEKTISTRTFLAINRAGLVFDGLLVIGSECKTNDPYIYAAGSFTKYSRRYYADDLAPKYSNQYEIGYKLGLQIRRKLTPWRGKDEQDSLWNMKCNKGDKLVPRYVQPISRFCVLPGGLNYLSVVKPGKEVPLEVAMGIRDYGKVLVTGDCKTLDRQGYFRLHLNSFNAVETITCLAKFPIDRINLTSIWGKHEKLLNNLALRFELLMIPDLFEFFREPWACAIYHDRFKFLEENVNEIMCSLTSEEGESLIEDLISRFKKNKWSKLTKEERLEIEDKFIDSPYHRMLEKEVLDFLEDNYTYLTMYAHPYIVKMILQGYENSPLFNPE